MDSKKLAKNIRKDVLLMTGNAGAGHIGPILSIVDIVSVLYSKVMKIDINNPKNPNSDRFILSKGHAGACVYACLAELGFFKKEELVNYYSPNGTTLSGHVTHKGNPGVEFSTGSLGHGVSVAVGMALAGKIDKASYRVFTIAGNGECNEGSIWESIAFAAHHKLDNFTLIVDHNRIQSMGDSDKILDMGTYVEKFASFGAHVIEVDGHNHDELQVALKSKTKGKPTVIIAHTIKGKGVSFMENNNLYHSACAKGEDLEKALREIENQ